MTRRIVTAITAVAIAAVIAFGLPLGVLIQRQYRAEAILELERQATAATIEVPSTFQADRDPLEVPEGTDGATIGVYLPDGTKVAGAGPDRTGGVVREAASGKVADEQVGSQLVVAVPVTGQERVSAVVRAAQPTDRLNSRVQRAWAAMAALALVVAAGAFALALGLARRLQRPVDRLVESATILGRGDFSARAERSGVRELDDAAEALDATAARIGAIVERERAFSADASHQLRTPLTSMRLHLYQAKEPGGDTEAALGRLDGDVDRLEQTAEDLLRLARDSGTHQDEVDPVDLVHALEERWHGTLAAAGRPFVILTEGRPIVRASAPALRQILEVLLDNAHRHGSGRVTLTVREVGDGCAIDVHDEGSVTIDDPDAVFIRRSSDGPGHGIGLALARTLAEADGGRLMLTDPGPGPTFSLLLSAPNG